jgi:hypothetical protein
MLFRLSSRDSLWSFNASPKKYRFDGSNQASDVAGWGTEGRIARIVQVFYLRPRNMLFFSWFECVQMWIPIKFREKLNKTISYKYFFTVKSLVTSMKISVIIRPKYGWFPTSNSYRSSDVTTPYRSWLCGKWCLNEHMKITTRLMSVSNATNHPHEMMVSICFNPTHRNGKIGNGE